MNSPKPRPTDIGDQIFKVFVLGPIETNCYVLSDASTKKAIIIDPAVPSREVEEYISKNGIHTVFVVNTHTHADHIMGDASFGVPVFVHRAEKDWLSDPSKNLSGLIGPLVLKVKEVRTMEDGDVIDIGETRVKVIHTPGHTPGGVCLLAGKYLFSGDTLFCDGVGRTDLPGGDIGSLNRSITEKLFTLPGDTLVFPGHGPDTTIGREMKRGRPI
jgi:glyoxylase-like metal-dependent hydrolase (beta-lactamase superfamily II)